jgi:proteasome lid subunit RPN8/RPN11
LTDSEVDPLSYAIEQGYAEIYIMTPSGIVKHHKLRGNSRFVRVKVDSIPGIVLNPLKEELSFLPAGKINYELLHQVESFFKKVIQVKGTAVEAMIWILWNEAQGYHLFVPNQTVSKASARYDWAGVPSGSSIIVDIHSHADFNAFFSGTDNADDQGGIRFSGVIGHNDKAVRSYAWRFNYKDKKFDVKVDDLFEIPQVAPVDTPEDWLNKVNTSAPAYSGNYGPSSVGKWTSGYATADRSGVWGKNTSRRDMGQQHPLLPEGEVETFMEEFNRKRGAASSNKKKEGSSSKKEVSSSAEQAEGLFHSNIHTRHEFWESSDFLGDDIREARAQNEINKIMSMNNLIEDEPGEANLVGGESLSDVEMMSDFVVCAVTSAQTNPRFDEIVCNNGLEAATGFCVIADLMASVDGNDALVEELVTDMAMMIDGKKRTSLIRSLYESLPDVDRDRLATNGF